MFKISIIIFSISFLFTYAADYPKEKDGYTQIRKANQIKDNQEAIKAYKSVVAHWANTEYSIAAISNMADRYIELQDYKTAEKLVWDHLVITKQEYSARRWVECKVKLGASEEDAIKILKEQFPENVAAILLSKANKLLIELLQNNTKNNEKSLFEIHEIIRDVIFNYPVDKKKSMIIKSFISKISILAITFELKHRQQNGEKFKGTMTKGEELKINQLSITYPTELFDPNFLMQSEEGMKYIIKQNAKFRSAALDVIKESIRNGNKLNEQALSAIKFLQDYRMYKKIKRGMIKTLKGYLAYLKDEKDVEVINNLINEYNKL